MDDSHVKSNYNQSYLSRANKISIPIREISMMFDKFTYRSDYLSGILDKKTFEEHIEQANKKIGLAIFKKRKNDEIRLPKYFNVLSATAIILAIVYIILIGLSKQSHDTMGLIVISLICLVSSGVIVLGLSIINFCRKPEEFIALEHFIKVELDNYFKSLNEIYPGALEFKFIQEENMCELTIYKKSDVAIQEEQKERNSRNGSSRRPINETDEEPDDDEEYNPDDNDNDNDNDNNDYINNNKDENIASVESMDNNSYVKLKPPTTDRNSLYQRSQRSSKQFELHDFKPDSYKGSDDDEIDSHKQVQQNKNKNNFRRKNK
jgi:hypothetical protein